MIHEAYRVLDKEVSMGMPGPCMTAISEGENVGIGSPYGKGAERIWGFFGTALHKIQSSHDTVISGINLIIAIALWLCISGN